MVVRGGAGVDPAPAPIRTLTGGGIQLEFHCIELSNGMTYFVIHHK